MPELYCPYCLVNADRKNSVITGEHFSRGLETVQRPISAHDLLSYYCNIRINGETAPFVPATQIAGTLVCVRHIDTAFTDHVR